MGIDLKAYFDHVNHDRLYLHPLDCELEKRGLSFVRYADDIAIFGSSERSAARVMASVTGWIDRALKLPGNREKSGHGPSNGRRCSASG